MDRDDIHAIIMGGGPAGLAAGKVLTDFGVRATVLEKDNAVGGLSRTHNHNGFLFDLGGHRFFTKKTELDQFLNDLLGNELIAVDRSSHIYLLGKFFNYPPTILNAFRGLGPLMSASILTSFFADKWRYRNRNIATLEDWTIQKFGRRMFEIFFKTYSEKVWGVGCDRVSAAWAAQRIKGMDLLRTIRETVFPSKTNRPVSLIENFKYPLQGIGRISDRLAEQILVRNDIRLNVRAVGVLHEKDKITGIRIRHEDGREEVIAGTHVLSSIPVTELVKILDPPAPPEVQDAAGRLRYRDLLVVTIFFNQDRITEDTWIYFPDPSIRFGRIHEPKNWSPAMSPEGKTSLVFEYFCFDTDPVWNMKDSELATETLEDFRRIRLCPGSDKTAFDHCVVRARRAYPLHELGHEENLVVVKSYLDRLTNLSLIGRYGQFVYNNIDHSIETGIRAAHRIIGHAPQDSLVMDDDYLEIKREP